MAPIAPALLGPLPLSPHLIDLTRFGLADCTRRASARHTYGDQRAQALFGGLAAHAIRPLEQMATTSFGLVLGMLGHAVGWPVPQAAVRRLRTP